MSIGRWFQNHPRLLEAAYAFTRSAFHRLDPLLKRVGYGRVSRLVRPGEELAKRFIFDCRMCGQCVLHSTGMTCPMTCPKELRNGPCGGVRLDGNCEVLPEMRCVWLEATERAARMPLYGKQMQLIQPPTNRRLQGASAWITMLEGRDAELPGGWLDQRSADTEQKR
ncbi:MAG TPA: methylenetetrahydrofolate reductase C-terminal domain-containing protein [Anaerolineae bacterium]|nr:methylenetetrahydrofolate reductase C-terminal domain-containing protein [Anaerolineae bacterium]